jgi:uncharacterized membrane protein YozB (DUF420 family)
MRFAAAGAGDRDEGVGAETHEPDGLSRDVDRFAPWVIGGLSFAVVAAIAAVLGNRSPAEVHAGGPSVLASLNASLNATSASLLLAGWTAIRRRRIAVHRACMLAAFAASSLFLVGYLLHHATVGSVPFPHQASWLRGLYFAILVPHVLLSAVVLPLALTTLYLAWRGRFAQHARLARWTLPIWLFVSVSGVAVYALLYHLPA